MNISSNDEEQLIKLANMNISSNVEEHLKKLANIKFSDDVKNNYITCPYISDNLEYFINIGIFDVNINITYIKDFFALSIKNSFNNQNLYTIYLLQTNMKKCLNG